jgi:ABC-type uncharacterized transport system permease subunit
MEAFEILFQASFWAAAIRIASPLIFATMGELICERAGVLNLGIEGIMVAGAFAGWITVYAGGAVDRAWRSRLLVGHAAFGLLHAGLTVVFRPVAARGRARHHAAGHRRAITPTGSPARGDLAAQDRTVPAAGIPVLSDIPFLGPALFSRPRSPISPS